MPVIPASGTLMTRHSASGRPRHNQVSRSCMSLCQALAKASQVRLQTAQDMQLGSRRAHSTLSISCTTRCVVPSTALSTSGRAVPLSAPLHEQDFRQGLGCRV